MHENNLLGERLSSFRKLNGLSLEQVAARADISKSYLSKLERGLSSPTIGTLLKLGQALGRSAEQLIGETAEDDDIVLVKAQDRVPFTRSNEREGYVYEAIAATRTRKAMAPFIMSPPSIVDEKTELAGHAGEELIFLVSGVMEVIFAERVVRLEAGDSLYFNASIPHRSRSLGKRPAKALVVVSIPDLALTDGSTAVKTSG
ncbi:helix-turn-helix domain-containing protein [Allopusillimonas ginsengisoli]|uniref:helix-turn-helix domain-containing protein n=1 Tax=Allopusillimonas ginsengisoli TaxID=453575 RepID=UPI001FD647C1|nr:XRE family transcriptional regulator [Allopusillimonas ginsengisoli]